MKKISKSILLFFETPTTYDSLGFFRILIGVFCFFEFTLMFPNRFEFIGNSGWVKWEISKAINNVWLPHIEDISKVLNLSEVTTVNMLFSALLFFCITFSLGFKTRFSALLLYLSHLALVSSMSLFIYGKDIILQVALFYCVFMPVGRSFSIDNVIDKVREKNKKSLSPYAKLSIRVLQIHLCIIYLTAGIEKAYLMEWWDGNAIWYALTQNDFNVLNFNFLKSFPVIAKLICIGTIILEISYAFIMWIPKIRLVCFIMIFLMHIFIGVFMRMPLFGALMIILSLVAWRTDLIDDYKNFSKKLT